MLAPLLAELCARARFGMDLGLDRVRAALAEAGDPHEGLAAVHVTGSNGKGSTSAMVESIARAAGLRTGLFTSPHLARFAERIRIDGEPVGDDAFERALGAALRAAGSGLTFFEALTVAGFLAFRDACVDVAVLEVGLGGRLDATNVIRAPIACAITSVSLEHTAVLGSTIEAIAREKAGILKPGAPYVLGQMPPEAERAIDEVARAAGAGPRWSRPLDPLPVALHGPHQRRNAAVAAALAELMSARWPRVRGAVPEGLARVRWPGRFEEIPAERGVTVILDGAHNAEGASALVSALADEGVPPERTTLVFGALADKSYSSMLSLVAPRASRRVFTSPKGRAPAPIDELARSAGGEAIAEPAAALDRALAITEPGGSVLITGSLYLVGELRARLLGLPVDPIIPL